MSGVATSTESSVYEQLAELTDERLVAVQAGDLDRLEQLSVRWAVLVAALPTDAPEHARAALERTIAGHDQIGVALEALRERLGHELALTGRGRRTANGYGAASALPVSSHQA